MGGTLAPWVGKLSMYHPYLPVAIFGINAIIGISILCVLYISIEMVRDDRYNITWNKNL